IVSTCDIEEQISVVVKLDGSVEGVDFPFAKVLVDRRVIYPVIERKKVGYYQDTGIGTQTFMRLVHQISTHIDRPTQFTEQIVFGGGKQRTVITFHEGIGAQAVPTCGR